MSVLRRGAEAPNHEIDIPTPRFRVDVTQCVSTRGAISLHSDLANAFNIGRGAPLNIAVLCCFDRDVGLCIWCM